MRKIKSFFALRQGLFKYKVVFLFIAVFVLVLPFIEPADETAPEIVFFFGRFHPLIIHFPVVLILLSLIFEAINRSGISKISSSVIGLILGLALIGSLFSVGLGFLLYYTGEYSGETMQQHLWGGILLTASVSVAMYLLLYYLQSGSNSIYTGYLSCLIGANLILIYTSHHGGSLTHGSEYLTEYMPSFSSEEIDWKPKPVEDMLVYEDLIVPFLDKKCMSCHNENKAKGGLNMTSYHQLLKGGKGDHPTLVPGSSMKSDLSRRISLPSGNEDVMPPEGKIPLSQDEISLLTWWIDQGADTTLKVTDASKITEIKPVVQEYLAVLEVQQRNSYIQQLNIENRIKTVANKDNFNLGLDPYDEKGITISMVFPPSSFEDNDFINIEAVASQITKASFIGSDITDDSFYKIGQMEALRELYLQQTHINGSGLVHLKQHKNLRLLDLSKTKISNGNLLYVLQIPGLEDLYINETEVSKDVVEALKENRPSLNIHLERGKLF